MEKCAGRRRCAGVQSTASRLSRDALAIAARCGDGNFSFFIFAEMQLRRDYRGETDVTRTGIAFMLDSCATVVTAASVACGGKLLTAKTPTMLTASVAAPSIQPIHPSAPLSAIAVPLIRSFVAGGQTRAHAKTFRPKRSGRTRMRQGEEIQFAAASALRGSG